MRSRSSTALEYISTVAACSVPTCNRLAPVTNRLVAQSGHVNVGRTRLCCNFGGS